MKDNILLLVMEIRIFIKIRRTSDVSRKRSVHRKEVYIEDSLGRDTWIEYLIQDYNVALDREPMTKLTPSGLPASQPSSRLNSLLLR